MLSFVGRAFVQPQHVLVALLVDAQGDDHEVIADVDAVDHERADRELAQLAAHHLRQCLRRRADEASTDRALARAARCYARRRRLQRTVVVARRDAEHHLLDRARRERIGIGEVLPRRQRYLTSVDATHPWTPHADATTAIGQLALSVPPARGLASAVVLVTATAQARAILFEHRGQNAHAGVHHALVERGACLEHRRQRELADVRRPLASFLLPGSVVEPASYAFDVACLRKPSQGDPGNACVAGTEGPMRKMEAGGTIRRHMTIYTDVL